MKLSQYTIKLNDFRKSFGFRIFIAFITVVFMSLSVFSLLQIYQESRTAKENLIKKGKIVRRFSGKQFKDSRIC